MTTAKVVLTAAFILLAAESASAWTLTMSWAASTGATSYRVDKSTDNGSTWATAGTVTTPTFTYTGTEPGLVLFRVTAINAVGSNTRTADGIWHNEAFQVPLPVGQLLVQ